MLGHLTSISSITRYAVRLGLSSQKRSSTRQICSQNATSPKHPPAMTQTRLDLWLAQSKTQDLSLSLSPNSSSIKFEIGKTFCAFNFIQVNVCSLTAEKADVLRMLASEHECSVLCISELGHRRSISGWKCISTTDTFSQSGIFVRHGIVATKIECPLIPCIGRIAWQGVKLEMQSQEHQQVILLHVYIPPDTNVSERKAFWTGLNNFAQSLRSQLIWLAGDLNTRSACFDPNEMLSTHSYMESFLEDLPWSVITDGSPTRSEHCLDITLANDNAASHTISWQPLAEMISDHLPCLT